MIKIYTVGGYDEVGRNMTAVEVNNEIVILDMGIHLEPYIKAQDKDPFGNPTADELHAIGAIPDDSKIDKKKVVAIVPSHAHLDHIGAIPYMESEYNAKIVCTPFCREILRTLAQEKHIELKNKIKVLKDGKTFKTKALEIEFIPITHSTIQTVIVAIHTKYGTVLYANDFKIDDTPIIGEAPNLDALAAMDIQALICDCIYAGEDENTPSEQHAKNLLEDLFKTHDFGKNAIIISTFSSHLARLQTIVRCAKMIKRKVIFLGRSLAKYVEAAENAGIMLFEDVEIVKYRKHIKQRLKVLSETKDEYVIVATGHQGEPNAVLMRIATQQLPFELKSKDVIIFSSSVIPVEENERNSEVLQQTLEELGVTIFRDMHVSGHAAGKDLKDFIDILKPRHIIPAHGPHDMKKNLTAIAKELGYKNEFLHLCQNGDTLRID